MLGDVRGRSLVFGTVVAVFEKALVADFEADVVGHEGHVAQRLVVKVPDEVPPVNVETRVNGNVERGGHVVVGDSRQLDDD